VSKRVSWIIAGTLAIGALCGGAYRVHVVSVRHAAEAAKAAALAAKAEHEAALADADQITRESKEYWDDKNRRLKLRNDELALSIAQLEYDTAGMQDRPRNSGQIEKMEAIVRNDKLNIDLLDALDTGEPTLNPYQEEERIQEHNQKYPHNKIASIGDINKEIQDFQGRLNSVDEQSGKPGK
jgi:hypothetical protein